MAEQIVDAVQQVSTACDIVLKDKQKECLEFFCSGRDLLAVLPTGYGKSIVYYLAPKIFNKVKDQSGSIVLVISPLVALMIDQVKRCESMGIKAAVIGQTLTDNKLRKEITDGKVEILFGSPEAVVNKTWRRVLSSKVYQEKLVGIAVDEAHCVDQWGKEFRRDFLRIRELRSVFTSVPMMALTATATAKSRTTIIKNLGLLPDVKVVESLPNRPNIMYAAMRSDSIESLNWLIDEIRTESSNCEKCIVYCRNIRSCSTLYLHFIQELGRYAYRNGDKEYENRLIAMFHRASESKHKEWVLAEFTKESSTIRVLFATVAFGMGVDSPDISCVIHWGASRSFDSFYQESGRAGRNASIQASSMVYFHGRNISAKATDTAMREYCMLEVCRREFIVHHFSCIQPCDTACIKTDTLCRCCDNCRKKCACGGCPEIGCLGNVNNDSDDELLEAAIAVEETLAVERGLSESELSTVRTKLYEHRLHLLEDSLLVDNDTGDVDGYSLFTDVDLVTGLSDRLINEIVDSANNMFTIDDVLTEFPFLDVKHAEMIINILESLT